MLQPPQNLDGRAPAGHGASSRARRSLTARLPGSRDCCRCSSNSPFSIRKARAIGSQASTRAHRPRHAHHSAFDAYSGGRPNVAGEPIVRRLRTTVESGPVQVVLPIAVATCPCPPGSLPNDGGAPRNRPRCLQARCNHRCPSRSAIWVLRWIRADPVSPPSVTARNRPVPLENPRKTALSACQLVGPTSPRGPRTSRLPDHSRDAFRRRYCWGTVAGSLPESTAGRVAGAARREPSFCPASL